MVWILTPAQAACGGTNPTILCVDKDAAGNNDGTSWADAYTTLQDALANANAGAEIWVATGVYTPGAFITSTFRIT